MKKSFLLFIICCGVITLKHSFSQSIVFIRPNYLTAGTTTNITITGINTSFTKMPKGKDTTNFYFYNSYWFNYYYNYDIKINSYTVINDTAISANITVNGHNGYSDLIFIDYSLKGHPVNYGRRYAVYINSPQSPQIVSVTPNKGLAGQTLAVSIIGKNSNFKNVECFSGGSGYYFDFVTRYNPQYSRISINKLSVDKRDDTHMTAKIQIPETTETGSIDFLSGIYCDGGFGRNIAQANVFYVKNNLNPPRVLYTEPGYANKNQILEVSIIGSNTKFTAFPQPSTSTLQPVAEFNNYMNQISNGTDKDIIVNNIKVINDTFMKVNATILPYAKNGLRDFKLVIDNTYFKNNLFSIGPNLIGIYPNIANVNETRTFEINCENVNFYNKGIRYFTVWLYTIYSERIEEIFAKNVEIKSDTKLSATFDIPADAYQGLWFVNIANNIEGYFYKPDILEIGLNLSTENIQKSNKMNIFPNPFSNSLTIEYNSENSNTALIELYNLTGDKIISQYQQCIKGSNNLYRLKAKELGLRQGMYILKLKTGKNSYYSKVVYQK